MSSERQVLSGRYRLLSLEGEGGMADVYKAQDLELERTVALKVLRTEHDAGDAFRREARAVAKLPHPNIVTVYDVGQDGDIQYIVMEYVEGQDLKELVQAKGPLRVGHALDIIVQVCEAVGFGHEKGIIHCDVKPQNVLVLEDGRAKVTDFGIARALSTASPEQRSKIWGTPHYAPPELISGKPLTPASDVYAIGILLYELLSGRPPFDGQSAAEIARQQVMSAPPPIQHYNPRVPRYVRQVIDRALAKDPTARYLSARQLGRHLAAYRRHSEAVTQPLQPLATADAPATDRAAAEHATLPARVALQPRTGQGVDWLMLLLAGLAFVAVMGLLPLWGTILTRALTQPTPVPAATPMHQTPIMPTATQAGSAISTPIPPTQTTELQVSVPDLVGQELAEARRLVREKGLVLSVTEQRHDGHVPVSSVIAQDIAADERVPPGTEIGVVVSLGPEMVIMPQVVGFPASIEQLELRDLGLAVTMTETWSVEPIGLVITQTPTAGTEVVVGSVVTLTVSGGPRHQIQVEANFDDKLLLFSCEFNDASFRPGDTVQVMITWQVLERLSERYTLFIHIADRDGKIWTQKDEPPIGGHPTDKWRPGEKLVGSHILTLPTDIPPGEYRVHVGLYRQEKRLPVVDPGSAQTRDNAVIVNQIEVGEE